ncbi:UNVERIFIED_CONTAM: hypothetical protein FKN15_072974 [Acipenser sinensis]
MAPRPQKFPAFPDFMEEICFSWDCPASGPSVLKQAAPLASLEGADKLSLVGLPPVDSFAALVKASPVGGLAGDPACPNLQCKNERQRLPRSLVCRFTSWPDVTTINLFTQQLINKKLPNAVVLLSDQVAIYSEEQPPSYHVLTESFLMPLSCMKTEPDMTEKKWSCSGVTGSVKTV